MEKEKIPTIFQPDPEKPVLVMNTLNQDCLWVFDGEGIPTKKYSKDLVTTPIKGSATLYKRRVIKVGGAMPPGFMVDRVEGKKCIGWVPFDVENERLIACPADISDFDGLKRYFFSSGLEGIIFHHKDAGGRMAKIEAADFGMDTNVPDSRDTASKNAKFNQWADVPRKNESIEIVENDELENRDSTFSDKLSE